MNARANVGGLGLLGLCVWGCSALVSPDPSRLGGAGTDAGRVDPSVDAFSMMACAGGCDDGVGCTVDSCNADVCQSLPDDGRCAPTERCTPTGCISRMCAGAEICGNGVDDDCNPATPDTCSARPDDCASAQVVDVSSGSAVLSGDFGALRADYASYCIDEGRRAGRDAVYRLDLGSRVTDLRIETLGAIDTVVSVSAECGAFGFPTCNDDQRPGADVNGRVWVHPAAGTLYVLVSAFDAEGGAYQVSFTATPMASNECGDGSLDVTRGGTVVGVSLPPNRATGTCMPDGTGRAIESVMHHDGGSISRLRLFAGYPTYLYARSSCDIGTEVRCAVGSPIGATGGTFLETSVSSGARRLHLFVDGASRSDEVYALFVEP